MDMDVQEHIKLYMVIFFEVYGLTKSVEYTIYIIFSQFRLLEIYVPFCVFVMNFSIRYILTSSRLKSYVRPR